ncbi:uncharacterized protein RCC_04193 [Ramularia collo-cygni]|uniref:Uncharacterized protein n=1 Tax=Ramularia collo-cygni TaxID=112498 RepID=A0A2D3V9Z0_9PEZI|nr:uncharacterized protein RCC_04193 [Ramularia collo-cygni]CZT18349.1 uncharacterized protein RCC_04193 [Ramularia collo-cygni]
MLTIQAVPKHPHQEAFKMTTFMTLPQELRDRIYEFIALEYPTRRIQTIHTEEVTYPIYKTTTSPITATCRSIHNDYEAIAKKLTTALEFTAINMDFQSIMTYFHRQVDPKFLTNLHLNKAKLQINILIPNVKTLIQDNIPFKLSLKDSFYPWALFLLNINLQVSYHSDTATWMHLFDSFREDLQDQCVVEKDTCKEIRQNIEEIRRLAGGFDRNLWLYRQDFAYDLQFIRHRRAGTVYRPRRNPRTEEWVSLWGERIAGV